MNILARRFAERVLWLTGLSSMARRILAAEGRFVIELHGVTERVFTELPPELRPSMTATSLRRLLSWLGQRFEFLRPSDLLESAKPGILLTFDDGFANNREVALPILEEFAAPAVFFVSSRHVGVPRDWLPFERQRLSSHGLRPEDLAEEVRRGVFDGMSAAQLRDCAQHPLITVGSHTVDHCRLVELSDRDLWRQLIESREYLADVSGSPVGLIAYPFGEYDSRVAMAVKSAGYAAAFAERSRGISDLLYGIPRVGIYSASKAYLAAKLSGIYERPIGGPIVR